MNDAHKIRLHIQENPESGDFLIRHQQIEAMLKASPVLADKFDLSNAQDDAGLDRALQDTEVLLASSFRSQDLSRRAPLLRWVQSTNAGVESLIKDIPDGIALTNASGVHAQKGAEFAMMALLSLNSRMGEMLRHQRATEWTQVFSPTIAGRTVAILGAGA